MTDVDDINDQYDNNSDDTININININEIQTYFDECFDMLSEMSFLIENYCEENNLPIFNKPNKHNIVIDYFLNDPLAFPE